MNVESWGGGLVVLLVAALWLVYLVPTWHRRRQYLATERNAVRLQQTLRILAQTAEVPEQVRIEANARSVADAQRVLAAEEAKRQAIRRAHEAARQREVTRELAAAQPVLRAADRDPVLAARRLRRSRLVATLVLVASAALVVLGLTDLASTWVALVAGLLFGAGSVAVLGQLAAVSAARARRQSEQRQAPEAQPFRDFAEGDEADAGGTGEVEQESRTWTPVPVPKPLYLRRGRQAPAAAAAPSAEVPPTPGPGGGRPHLTVVPPPRDHAAELREVAARDLAALREAQRSALRDAARAESALEQARRAASAGTVQPASASAPAPTPAQEAPPRPAPEGAAPEHQAPPAAPSRFARMGLVDDLGEADFSVDEALRRRRAV
ncbi:hypothetical protein [Frigoribacterium salinisoli]